MLSKELPKLDNSPKSHIMKQLETLARVFFVLFFKDISLQQSVAAYHEATKGC